MSLDDPILSAILGVYRPISGVRGEWARFQSLYEISGGSSELDLSDSDSVFGVISGAGADAWF